MSKKDKIEFRTLRSNKQCNGTIFIMTLFQNGGLSFEMAKQSGFTKDGGGRNLPKFDYENTKINFSLSDLECAQIVCAHRRQVLGGPHEFELRFPHHSAKVPKNISFKFIPNQQGMMQMQVTASLVNSQHNCSIYLNEFETEVVVENLKAQYSLHAKHSIIATNDDYTFKSAVAPRIIGG